MPQDMECVYEVATGKPVYMHSVDAAEACTLGDYTRMPPSGHEVTDQERAAAMATSRGMPGTTHPELQTPEERAESRRLANEAAGITTPAAPMASTATAARPRATAPAEAEKK
jgi:hypothetical protein